MFPADPVSARGAVPRRSGAGAFADVYATQVTDHPPGRVDLYLSPYSRRALGEASGRLCRIEDTFPIHSCAAAPGATGVEVDTDAAGAAFEARLSKAAGGIPVTVREGRQVLPAVGWTDGPAVGRAGPSVRACGRAGVRVRRSRRRRSPPRRGCRRP